MPCIYGLYDVGGQLRYIGKANDMQKRLKGHMRAAKEMKTPLYAWIRKRGRPVMKLIEVVDGDWQEAEKRHIAEARAAGADLLNVANGGDEPYCAHATRVANGKRLQVHPNTVVQRKINAARMNENARSGLKPDGSPYSYSEFVVWAYERMLKLFRRQANVKWEQTIVEKMAQRHQEDSTAYACWKWANHAD